MNVFKVEKVTHCDETTEYYNTVQFPSGHYSFLSSFSSLFWLNHCFIYFCFGFFWFFSKSPLMNIASTKQQIENVSEFLATKELVETQHGLKGKIILNLHF